MDTMQIALRLFLHSDFWRWLIQRVFDMRLRTSGVQAVVICGLASAVLASCSTVSGGDQARFEQRDRPTLTIAPQNARLSDPTVTTSRPPVEYLSDLEQCRDRVAKTMGAQTSYDEVAALKRAVGNAELANKVRVEHVSTDRAVVRDNAVKKCLRSKKYLVKN